MSIATTALLAPAAATGAAAGGATALIMQFVPFIAIFVLFWFLLIRPQQKRVKEHRAMVESVKRGDTVVLSSGMIGKVTRVENDEAMVEIAQGVNTRVVKAMITEVRNRTEVAANDVKTIAKG